MRIGIITFHQACNYGAVLQCYALVTVLKSMGYNVEVINYLPYYFKAQHRVFSIDALKGLNLFGKIEYCYKSLKNRNIKLSRIRGFEKFIEKLPLSIEVDSEYSRALLNYDIFVFGSDQIWNPRITLGFDPIYYGLFDKSSKKFISYAASSQLGDIVNFKEEFAKLANRFDKISVRETWLRDYFISTGNENVKVVIDPVLLLTSNIWNKLCVKTTNEKYVLIYTVPQNKLVYKIAKSIAQILKIKIIELVANVKDTEKECLIQDATPEQFVSYFKNAEFVVTTSFHGTAFSILYNKAFYTVSCGGNLDDRSRSLLERLGISDRLVDSEPTPIIRNIDYNRANCKLEEYRKDSIDFINQSLRI